MLINRLALRSHALSLAVMGASFLTLGAGTGIAQDASKTHRVAFFATGSQNSWIQAALEGMKKQAEEMGGASVDIFDGNFNAITQFSQVENVVAGGQYDAMIIIPVDAGGIVNVIEDAVASGMKVVSMFQPIGPRLDTMEPQVEGLSSLVATDLTMAPRAAGEKVKAHCQGKDPCRVVILIGGKDIPLGLQFANSFQAPFADAPNIQVVAVAESRYRPDVAMTVMQNILQANPAIDAVMTDSDAALLGAQIALEDAGLDNEAVYTVGTGASRAVITEIREGKLDATLTNVPVTMGALSMEAAVKAAAGEPVEPFLDPVKKAGLPLVIDRETLDQMPEFAGEYPG